MAISKKRKDVYNLTLRMPRAEAERWMKVADADGRSLSNWLRVVGRAAATAWEERHPDTKTGT